MKLQNSPTQRMLKVNPWPTDLLTSWSGRLSKPTWPDSAKFRTFVAISEVERDFASLKNNALVSIDVKFSRLVESKACIKYSS